MRFTEGHIPWNKGIHRSLATKNKISQSLSRKIERTCQQCGKTFLTIPSRVKQELGKFCSQDCYSNYMKGRPLSPHLKEIRNKQSQDPIIRLRLSQTIKEANKRPEVKERKSQASLRMWQEPGHRAKMSKAHRKRYENPKERQKVGDAIRKLWQDPKYIAKVMASRGVKPTKPEKELDNILKTYFPQFKYNGDGSLGITLAGMIPDFVNVNGKKEVIELFGDYYHSPEMLKDWRRTELGRIMAYSSLGFKCLIIWEHELKELTEEQLVDKIRTYLIRGGDVIG